jgi:ankyrin repeat protein
MKKYLTYIKENITIEEDWFNAIKHNNIKKVKELINSGIDINIQDDNGKTALIIASFNGFEFMVDLLLQQPDIDVNIQDNHGNTALIYTSCTNTLYNVLKLLITQPDIDITIKNDMDHIFMDYILYDRFLKKYELQKKILDNNRDDIILFFDKHNLVNYKIKKEYANLFKAEDWGLVS